jgi:molybdopterin molybdotransferase
VGYGALRVHPRPRVGVLATGAELVAPGEPLRHGQIPDSNSTLMRGLVQESGAEAVDLGAVDDTPDALRRVLDESLGRVDAIVTSGGVSAGAYDVIKEVLEPLGAVRFTKVAMQPGKPQGFGLLDVPGTDRAVPLFALPGNPVSVFVSFHVLVRPALARLRGATAGGPLQEAVAATGWTSPPGRQQYVPVVLEEASDAAGRARVRPATSGGSGSHLVASLALADALAVVEPQTDRVDAGDAVRVMMIS